MLDHLQQGRLQVRFFADRCRAATIPFGNADKIRVAFNREWTFAIEIGLLDTSIKLLVYYWHERAWLRIGYGRPEKKRDYQI